MVTARDTDDRTVRADQLAATLRQGMPVTERRLDCAGVSTALLEGGDGPPLVLLHGQGAFAEAWGPVLPHLVASHRVIAPDLPGLGRSEVRTGSLDVGGVVEWLDELIDQTCTEPPTVVGISLGGSIGAHFAIDHSDRIRRTGGPSNRIRRTGGPSKGIGGLVLVASGSLGRFRPAPGGLIALIRYLRRPNPTTHERFFSYVVNDPDRARSGAGERWAAMQRYHINRAGEESVRAANRALIRRVSMGRIPVGELRRIAAPVSLIWGRDDRIMRFRIAEKVSAELDWPLYAIDDCGHFAVADRPEAFLEALRRAVA